MREVEGASVAVSDGELVALLGASGAGKSIMLKAVSGLVSSRAGRVRFRSRKLDG